VPRPRCDSCRGPDVRPVSGDPDRRLEVFLAAGASRTHISGLKWHKPSNSDYHGVILPQPDFKNGEAWSFIMGGGLAYRLAEGMTLRLDVRVPSQNRILGERVVLFNLGMGFSLR